MFSLLDLRSSLFSWDLDELLAQRNMDLLSELDINQGVQKDRSCKRSFSCYSCCPRFCTASAVPFCICYFLVLVVVVVAVALADIVVVSDDFIKSLRCYLRFVVSVLVVVIIISKIFPALCLAFISFAH